MGGAGSVQIQCDDLRHQREGAERNHVGLYPDEKTRHNSILDEKGKRKREVSLSAPCVCVTDLERCGHGLALQNDTIQSN